MKDNLSVKSETENPGMDEKAVGGTCVALASLGAAVFAPFLAGPALIGGMIAGLIALNSPTTPTVVKAAIWASFAGLYFLAAPAALTMFFGDDLGDLATLATIFKVVGGLAAVAAAGHLVLALKEMSRATAR
ncbi:hypothetical protein [Brevundimonas naejangsanensis]|uniref:hypothetical protein n=1 Tax=Brevundimonas naejangsanensis TaxID=588932 RepID=UPI003D027EA2